MNDEKQKKEWDSGVYGMFWVHTAYGGDDHDAMMYCTLDDPKAQTAGVRVQMPDGLVDFHMNVDRLGRVDPQDGQRAFDLNVEAARLFVAAPELLAALETLLLSTERDDMNAPGESDGSSPRSNRQSGMEVSDE